MSETCPKRDRPLSPQKLKICNSYSLTEFSPIYSPLFPQGQAVFPQFSPSFPQAEAMIRGVWGQPVGFAKRLVAIAIATGFS